MPSETPKIYQFHPTEITNTFQIQTLICFLFSCHWPSPYNVDARDVLLVCCMCARLFAPFIIIAIIIIVIVIIIVC